MLKIMQFSQGDELKKLLLITLFLACSSASLAASKLSDFSKEFLGINQNIDQQSISAEQAEIDVQLIDAYRTWSLFYEGSLEDDSLESSSTLRSNPSETMVQTLGVTKSFDWGGSLSFSNSMSSIQGSNFFGTLNGKTYGFSQTLSYSQDIGQNFFGANDKREIKEAELGASLQKILLTSEKEQGLLRLTTAWTDAKLALALLNLQNEALERAKRREVLVSKRVRDGLKERVDLYQAQGSRELQIEELRNSEIALRRSLESLGKELHRDVDKKEVAAFDFNPEIQSLMPQGQISTNNQIKVLETRMEILSSTLERKDNSLMPDISLTGSYTSNDFDSQNGEAISNGMIGSDTKETSIGVSLTWPIGSRPAKLEKSKAIIEKNYTQKRKEKIQKNVEITEEFLRNQITLLEKNLVSGKKRRELAQRALREYNKLYNRGRADLDAVIRAEEALITTEKQFVQSMAGRSKVLFQLAYLYGSLGNYVMKVGE